jgi:hypothetical protein
LHTLRAQFFPSGAFHPRFSFVRAGEGLHSIGVRERRANARECPGEIPGVFCRASRDFAVICAVFVRAAMTRDNAKSPDLQGIVWSEWQDLNLRPPRPERDGESPSPFSMGNYRRNRVVYVAIMLHGVADSH